MRVSAGNAPVTGEQAKSRLNSRFFAATFAAAMLLGGGAQAENYKFGEMNVSVDTTISAGISMRTSARDCEKVNFVNGGCMRGDGRGTGINSDNGNLNFDQWDLTDALVRATVDIQAKWKNYGIFLRPTAFYNQVYAENNMQFRDLSHDAANRLNYRVDVLDAFVYANYDIGGHYTTIRIGKQVLNWGESLFIQGGVNQFQALDVSAIRTPGAELKDALTPMPMIYASFAATDALTLEAFWQFGYEKTYLDPAGSFFSTDDIVGEGSLPALSGVKTPGFDNPDLALANGDVLGLLGGGQVPIALNRTEDRGQSDLNQFGVAAHYYADNVGSGTDFGLYFTRYSSRLPYLGFTNGANTFAQSCTAVFGPGGCTVGAQYPAAFAYGANFSSYFYDFPTINTFGASFSTTLGATAVSGEVTYSPDMPFGISDLENNASQIDGTGAGAVFCGGSCSSYLNPIGPNQSTLAHIDLDAYQGQIGTINSFTTTDFLPRNLGADGGTLVVNAGFVYVPDAGDWPLNRVGPEAALKSLAATALLGGATDPQYATSFSAGYQALVKVDYNNAFGTPITLSPSIAFRHDVLGYSPGPITANYLKGLKQVSLGVSGTYQQIKASLSWTSSFGAGFNNPVYDRDFASASVSYAF
jgi:hypothetical protein